MDGVPEGPFRFLVRDLVSLLTQAGCRPIQQSQFLFCPEALRGPSHLAAYDPMNTYRDEPAASQTAAKSRQAVVIGGDHAGFHLKRHLLAVFLNQGVQLIDCGCDSEASCDFPDFAEKVSLQILQGQAERGILVCGSGVGVSVAANKIPGIRASVCHDTYSARQGVEHDDMNVLCIGARIVGSELAAEIVRSFLNADYAPQPRHQARLDKILEIEHRALKGIYSR